jgi:F0F1-type ATP synthase assembly protein I
MSTTNKVLLGVGIGCGTLVLLGMIGIGAGAWWLKRQVGDSVSNLVESSQKMQAMGQQLQELEKSHPFTPPPEGEVLALSEERLLSYLAVRETVLPVYAKFQKQAEALEAKHEAKDEAEAEAKAEAKDEAKDENKDNPGLGEVMQAAGLLTELMAQVHGAYIEGLKKQGMSPREFRTITQTLYSSMVTGVVDQAQKAGAAARQEALESVREQMKDPSLTEEQLAEMKEHEQALLDSAEDPEGVEGAPVLSEASKAAAAANLVLMDKYQERINSAGSLAMDTLLFGGDIGEDTSGNVARDQQ